MVLWEITLGTAYFLGLRRTYKLALRIQRKLIGPKHPKIRQFVQRRTRSVFDIALKVHLKVQERDIEVGRNLGNWILRWLDKIKPEAQIRGPTPTNTNPTEHSSISRPRHLNSNQAGGGSFPKPSSRSAARESDRHLFTATARSMWPKSFPMIALMMARRPMGRAGQNIQFRQYGARGSELLSVDHGGKFGLGQVVRNDLRQWAGLVSHS